MSCAHGMPNPNTCWDCMEEGPVGKRPATRKMRAQFASDCPNCFEKIEIEDRIGLVDGEWVCSRCHR